LRLLLGLIGSLWSGRLAFGLVIGLAAPYSMGPVAFMGTRFPMVPTGLGFGPAATVGPFESAFQDMIGWHFSRLAALFANRM
jgi:magnesium transporter